MTGPNLLGEIITVPDCPKCGGWIWVVGRRAWCMKPYAAGGCAKEWTRWPH